MVTLSTIPEYEDSVSIPENVLKLQILVRYYDGWGDGTAQGWQSIIAPPEITINNQPVDLILWFAKDNSAYHYMDGQVEGAFDQYAQYYQKDGITNPEAGSIIRIKGSFPICSYFSVQLTYDLFDNAGTIQDEIFDYQFTPINGGLNPFIKGNPSVFSYVEMQSTRSSVNKNKPQGINKCNATSKGTGVGSIDFYRPDTFISSHDLADDVAPDGCTKAYLLSDSRIQQDVYIFRIKMPTTFIHNDNPDTVFGEYDCHEFSVNSSIKSDEVPAFDFWAVNSRMLNTYLDSEGYAYVFFVPANNLQELIQTQGTLPTVPPIITWGLYTGYVLLHPTAGVVLRYRVPNDNWQGNPVNAMCYINVTEQQPVTESELGEFLPEMYADSMDNFLAGKIGAVSADQPWPV